MNPLTNVKNITKLNELELAKGLVDKKSWHDMYKDSAWVFIGGLSYGLTEGDILCVFSQYGEIVNLNLVRDKKTGKTKGFCFLCYANQKSTVLAVDNLNSIKLCGRTLRVDHVSNYKPPKDNEHDDELTKELKNEGCAPRPIKLESSPIETEVISEKKKKKEKKKHKKKSIKQEGKISHKKKKLKKEKHDPGYDKYEFPQNNTDKLSRKKHMGTSDDSESSSSESSNNDLDHRADNSRYSHEMDSLKMTQQNPDQARSSSYYNSRDNDSYQKSKSITKHRYDGSESDSGKEGQKRRRLHESQGDDRTRRNKQSESSHNKVPRRRSSSHDSSEVRNSSSSYKERSNKNDRLHCEQRSSSLTESHKSRTFEHSAREHKRYRRESSSSSGASSDPNHKQTKGKDYSTSHSRQSDSAKELSSSRKGSDYSSKRYKDHSGGEYESHSKSTNYGRKISDLNDRRDNLKKSRDKDFRSEKNGRNER